MTRKLRSKSSVSVLLLPLLLFLSPSESFSISSKDTARTTGRNRNPLGMTNSADDGGETQQQRRLFAGFDLGTSGCRVSIIEASPTGGFCEVYNDSVTWKECGKANGAGADVEEGRYDDPESWWIAIDALLKGCASTSSSLVDSIASICVSGTSASCLMVDRNTLEVTRNPRMYNYDVVTSSSSMDDTSGVRAVELLEKHLPPKHTARSSTGSFAKLVKWILQSPLKRSEVLCHQSDYISTKLMFNTKRTTQIQPQSDWQNCLKLGYDVRNLCWPLEDWMESCLKDAMVISGDSIETTGDNSEEDRMLGILPTKVVSPGAPLGCISETAADELGLSRDVTIVGGTTDSNAAFYAAAASGSISSSGSGIDDGITIPYGTAVTSLGSTTAIKFLSKTYVEDSTLGVYSHRFPAREIFSTTTANEAGNQVDLDQGQQEEAWLVGGASNVGCAVFRALDFTDDELKSRSADIDPSTDSEAYLRYKYYPLLPGKVGERFPTADATKKSVLEPIPADTSGDSRTEYLKGLFQSITTEVERKGYEVLRDLGASPPFPTVITTAGGGSKNPVWTSLRERIMNDGVDSGGSMVAVKKAENSEASYGAALLAAAGIRLRK